MNLYTDASMCCQNTGNFPREEDTRRVSCHRCGNIRKKRNTLCSRCPHLFCFRCTAKMESDYGSSIFVGSCPVCKEVCCCGKNKSEACQRQHHCYRKCPASKRRCAGQRHGTSTNGPTGLNLGSVARGSYSVSTDSQGYHTPYLASSNSTFAEVEAYWSELDGQSHHTHHIYSNSTKENTPRKKIPQRITRSSDCLDPSLFLDDASEYRNNHVTLNGVGNPATSIGRRSVDHTSLQSNHINQLPGLNTIQKARSLLNQNDPGTLSVVESGVTTISGLPSSAENINFDDDFTDFGFLFDSVNDFDQGSPGFLSDENLDFELNFLDEIVTEDDNNTFKGDSAANSICRTPLASIIDGRHAASTAKHGSILVSANGKGYSEGSSKLLAKRNYADQENLLNLLNASGMKTNIVEI